MALNVYDTGNKAENVSRKELLTWVNIRLEGTYDRIEDMCTGAAYCQFMDILYPGVVNLKRVLFSTNLEHEFIRNFKLLQTAFTDLGINKDIPVARLVKGKFQDNYEFLVWFKKFFDANDDNRIYNASEARFGFSLGSKTSRPRTNISLRETNSRSRSQRSMQSEYSQNSNLSDDNLTSRVVSHFESPNRKSSLVNSETNSVPASAYMVNVHSKARQSHVTTASSGSISLPITADSTRPNSLIKPPSTVISDRLSRVDISMNESSKIRRESHSSREQKRRTEMEELVMIGLRLEELYMSVRAMEKERDFYYEKLLNVETWCSQQENSAPLEALEAILYSEDEFELSKERLNSVVADDVQDGQ
ncbi:microtubule-associated protein RP/EB family member 3-like [Pecten maximus]|uniref:microtubule-associated protein RP/EB family member 3-like n=1 Tax=Pecten maximus TaxID=6579 RepID=UPI0014584FC8|nr:microtubule-associated protein RP/EB family member 3-like [Pecten maximus]